MKVSICPECGASFPYLSKRVRQRCPGCSQEQRLAVRARDYQRERLTRVDTTSHPVEVMNRRRVSAWLGLSECQVRRLESRALRKLRGDRRLLLAWREFRQSGHRCAAVTAEEFAAALVAYQTRMQEFWEVHDGLRREGLTAEAAAVAAEIKQFQGLLRQYAASRPRA